MYAFRRVYGIPEGREQLKQMLKSCRGDANKKLPIFISPNFWLVGIGKTRLEFEYLLGLFFVQYVCKVLNQRWLEAEQARIYCPSYLHV